MRLRARLAVSSSAPLCRGSGASGFRRALVRSQDPGGAGHFMLLVAVAAAAAAAASLAILGLVHLDRATPEVTAIEGSNRIRCSACFLHLDESEAARAAGLPIHDDAHGVDGAVSAEGVLEIRLRGREGEVSDVNLLAQLIVLCARQRFISLGGA